MKKPEWKGDAPIDGRTPISFLVGFIAGMSGMNPSWAAVTLLSFESLLIALEHGRVDAIFNEQRSSQSYGNQTVDILVTIVGVHFGDLWVKKQQEKALQTNPFPVQPPTQITTPNTMEVSGVPWY